VLFDSDGAGLTDLRQLGVPVIALLSPAQRTHLGTLANAVMRGYLMKPVRQDSLEKRILAVLAGETELASPPAASTSVQQPHSASELSILVAEDNPVNALLARELLRRRGHRVDVVITGEAAVEACAARRFRSCPHGFAHAGLDGIDATLRIRNAEAETNAKPVPIFALTADAVETGRKACLEAGMDGFLTKPVDPADLDAVLATISPQAVLAAE
jgi:CheY-like chemotaxis protein